MDNPDDRLPAAYSRYLALRRLGLDDTAVAGRLGVPVESLTLLERLAAAKLSHLADPPPPPEKHSTDGEPHGAA